MTIFKLPKMNELEIKNLLAQQNLCRIAFKGSTHPYIAPFQYIVMNETLYFHFTDYGKKMKLLDKDKRVCVEVETYRPDLSEYKFVVIRGKLELVKDDHERADAIRRIANAGNQKLSTNFLAAHGLTKEEGWDSLTPERPMVIVKLAQVTEKIGLKSP
ncbi:MAG: pyridoxamine 5'-phosphate oxidase family protein [Candidatus Bathyarchaeota archaeon]|nr:MAG: pyridoxamine 5'-phosphate oxidase family protein [Candidatus Bathyarchaeota archaeon]